MGFIFDIVDGWRGHLTYANRAYFRQYGDRKRRPTTNRHIGRKSLTSLVEKNDADVATNVVVKIGIHVNFQNVYD